MSDRKFRIYILLPSKRVYAGTISWPLVQKEIRAADFIHKHKHVSSLK